MTRRSPTHRSYLPHQMSRLSLVSSISLLLSLLVGVSTTATTPASSPDAASCVTHLPLNASIPYDLGFHPTASNEWFYYRGTLTASDGTTVSLLLDYLTLNQCRSNGTLQLSPFVVYVEDPSTTPLYLTKASVIPSHGAFSPAGQPLQISTSSPELNSTLTTTNDVVTITWSVSNAIPSGGAPMNHTSHTTTGLITLKRRTLNYAGTPHSSCNALNPDGTCRTQHLHSLFETTGTVTLDTRKYAVSGLLLLQHMWGSESVPTPKRATPPSRTYRNKPRESPESVVQIWLWMTVDNTELALEATSSHYVPTLLHVFHENNTLTANDTQTSVLEEWRDPVTGVSFPTMVTLSSAMLNVSLVGQCPDAQNDGIIYEGFATWTGTIGQTTVNGTGAMAVLNEPIGSLHHPPTRFVGS